MRIISDRKDYYDSAQAFGQDQSIIYLRKKRTIRHKSVYRPYYDTHAQISLYVIGFCGMIYPVYKLGGECFYTISALEKAINNSELSTAWNNKYLWNFGKRNLQSWVPKLPDFFTKYHTPIWIFDYERRDSYMQITINPSNLRDYNFGKVFSAYAAYQEIMMYWGNELAQEKEPNPSNVPDKYLAAAKGFDKWSFRKMPTKKRK